MLVQIVALLLGTAADLLTVALLARVWMQWVRAPFRNPVGQFIAAVTNWVVLPLRRIIPGLFGIDLAGVFAAWFTQIVYFGIMAGLTGLVTVAPQTILGVALLAGLQVVRLFIYVLMGAILIAALLSWVAPYSPVGPLFAALTRPLLRSIQKIMPPLGGIDLSPLVVLLLLQVVLIVLGGLQPGALLLP